MGRALEGHTVSRLGGVHERAGLLASGYVEIYGALMKRGCRATDARDRYERVQGWVLVDASDPDTESNLERPRQAACALQVGEAT